MTSPPTPALRAARSVITPGGGDNRDPQTIGDLRQLALALVLAQGRLGHALEMLDDRLALEVLEGHGQLGLGAIGHREVGDVALFLQHAGHLDLQLGGRHGDRLLGGHLRIADTGEHIRQSVLHAHLHCAPDISTWRYQLDFFSPGTSPRMAASRSLLRPRPNLL